MVNRMTLSTNSRASLPGGANSGGPPAGIGRGTGGDPHDDAHSHARSPDLRARGSNDRRRDARDEPDEHSHDLGLAVVGLDEPSGRAGDVGESAPRGGESSAPPAAIATFEAAGELLRALAAPVRIAIVVRLGGGPQCVHDLVESTGAPQPLISQHLRVLRGAGVVRGVRRGREIAYSLTDEHIGHIVADAINHAREAR
jgi:DNA-binding transcriptional ArsR family regulator